MKGIFKSQVEWRNGLICTIFNLGIGDNRIKYTIPTKDYFIRPSGLFALYQTLSLYKVFEPLSSHTKGDRQNTRPDLPICCRDGFNLQWKSVACRHDGHRLTQSKCYRSR